MFKLINITLVILLTACTAFSSPLTLEQASEKYKINRDFESLQIIRNHLAVGIERKEIERLLGEPDYSPTDGLYYYSSNQTVFLEDQNRSTSPGLVVDYRGKNDAITETLQKFQIENIGE